MTILPTFFSTFAAKLGILEISAMGFCLKDDRRFPKNDKTKTNINHGKRIERTYQTG